MVVSNDIYNLGNAEALPPVERRIVQLLTLFAFGITGSLFVQNIIVSAELYPTVIGHILLIVFH